MSSEGFTKEQQSCKRELTEKDRTEQEAEIANSLEGKLTGYDCPQCKNKGVIYKAVEYDDIYGKKRWELKSRECNCVQTRRELMRIEQSGLSRLMKKYTFANYRDDEEWQSHIKSKAKGFAKNPEGWFYIGGQPGCGKTHICTAIVGELLKNNKQAKYMLWQDDITKLKQVATDYNTYERLMEQYKNAEVLYIDDFFKSRNKDSVSAADVNTTFKIINHRYNVGLCTIISSELSTFEICKIDEALGSRIMEMCINNEIYIKPDSFKNYRYKARENDAVD